MYMCRVVEQIQEAPINLNILGLNIRKFKTSKTSEKRLRLNKICIKIGQKPRNHKEDEKVPRRCCITVFENHAKEKWFKYLK